MSIIINKISVTIDGVVKEKFKCQINGQEYYVADVTVKMSQLSPGVLTFYLTSSKLFERLEDTTFNVCAAGVGKRIEVEVTTDLNIFQSILHPKPGNLEGTMRFEGFITKMEAQRGENFFMIKVTAHTFDHLMTLGKTCRSYVDKTLAEIVQDVVDNYQNDIRAIINPAHDKTIPYTVQYNESDYDFLKRLASTYGEWMYSDGENFIFGKMDEKDKVKLAFLKGEISDYNIETEPVNLSQEFVAGNYHKGDYSIHDIQEDNESIDHPLINKIKETSIDLAHRLRNNILVTHVGGLEDASYDKTRQKLQTEVEAARKLSKTLGFSGRTISTRLNIGTPLDVENNLISNAHDRALLSMGGVDEIIITEVEHNINSDSSYYNTFKGKPLAMIDKPGYNAVVTPKCPASTAKVVDNEDPEELGRVKVQFLWQEASQEDEMISPWIRLVQPYAGLDKGVSFIPEIGEQVMVGFIGDNPEKPFVMGALYNGIDKTDEEWLKGGNASNKVKAIRTRNGHTIEIHDEGDNGYIRIYDYKKENYILTFSTDEKLIKLESTGNIELYAKNDIIMHAGHDINASADNDIFIAAGNDMQRTADNDIREHAGNDRSTSIDRNDSLTVSNNQLIRVDENKDERVAHRLQTSAENIRTEAKDKLLEYSSTHHMKASQDLAVNASNRIDIKAAQVKTN